MNRRLGGAICIIPVRSQHCGLLFLPFADHDPKTAEIVSKTFLPARDREIKDPAILKQLRPRVNGRVEVPAGGQLKVPLLGVVQLVFRVPPPRARACFIR